MFLIMIWMQSNKSGESTKEKDMNNMNKELSTNKENSSQNVDQNTTKKMQLPLTVTVSNEQPEVFKEKEKSPTSVKDVKDIILSSSKNIIGKVLSPSKDKLGQNTKKTEMKKQPLMTRRELCDPFGSDDEDDVCSQTCTDNKLINSKIPEVNGDKTDCDSLENKDNVADRLPELPKPNPVSNSILVFFENC